MLWICIFARTEGELVVKRGPRVAIEWEHLVYSIVQQACGVPVVCEHLIQYEAWVNAAGLLLRHVVVLSDFFSGGGKIPDATVFILRFTVSTADAETVRNANQIPDPASLTAYVAKKLVGHHPL